MADTPRSADWYRNTYRDASVSGLVAAGTNGISNLITILANHTIFIQRITVNIHTSAAQTITFQDDSGSQKPLFIEASAAAGTVREVDYGARGVALTAGENLDIVQGGAGPAYEYSIEAYQRQTSAIDGTGVNRII